MAVWSWVQHHRLFSVVFLALLMVGTAGGTCWAVFFRTVASPVTLREALRMYSRDHARLARDGVRAVLSPGVFSYVTSGGESLNILGVSRSFPAETNMVVSPSSASCTDVDWVPIEEHTETTTVCPSAADSLSVSELVTHETIGGTTTATTVDCPATAYLVPPIAMPGVHWSAACRQVDPAEPVTMTGTVLGAAPMVVGGQQVSTLHVRVLLDFAGVDSGTSPVDFWISTARGLIVREQEVAHIAQGGVHYTETMDTRLTSLTPAAG